MTNVARARSAAWSSSRPGTRSGHAMTESSATQILEALGPSCRDTARRSRLLGQTALNGIDFVEFEAVVGPPSALLLHAHFLLDVDVPSGAYGLHNNPSLIGVHGGSRIVGITVLGANIRATDPKVLDIEVDRQGDYSPYLLSL